MRINMAAVSVILCLLLAPATLAQKQFTVGTEDLNFYPHYDFTATDSRGFANEVLRLFAATHGYQFSFQPLPVKRLYHELDNLVDFIYPDNPNWAKYQNSQARRLFSDPVIYNLGSTMVLPQNQHIHLTQFRTLAVIHGFTPTAWLSLRDKYRFKLYEVPNAVSAINLVLRGQLDGADVEYNVAQHILRQQQQEGALVVAQHLPVTRVSFHLSTTRHPQVLQQFNRFLLSHQEQISALKQKYQLTDSLPQYMIPPPESVCSRQRAVNPVPGGSTINFIPEVYPSDQLSCSNSFRTNLSGIHAFNG